MAISLRAVHKYCKSSPKWSSSLNGMQGESSARAPWALCSCSKFFSHCLFECLRALLFALFCCLHETFHRVRLLFFECWFSFFLSVRLSFLENYVLGWVVFECLVSHITVLGYSLTYFTLWKAEQSSESRLLLVFD